MKCSEIRKLIPEYITNELSPAQKREFEAHLNVCPKCHAIVEDYKFLRVRSQQLPAVKKHRDLVTPVMKKIKAAPDGYSENTPKKRSRRSIQYALAIGVAAVILFLVVIQPWHSPSPDVILARAYEVTSSLTSYQIHYKANTSNPEGTAVQSLDVRFSAPDSYHVLSLMESAELPVDSVEYILIGDQQYVRKFSDDYDINVDYGTPAVEVFLSEDYALQHLDYLTNIQELPDEKINGVDCFHYTGVSDTSASLAQMKEIEVDELAPSLRNMYTYVELWIGKDDYLIRQRHRTRMSTGEPDVLGTANMTIQYVSINEPIIIEPPLDEDGNLLEGWQLAGTIRPGEGRPTFTKSMTVSISQQEGYEDPVHKEKLFEINLMNDTDVPVKDIRIVISQGFSDGVNEPVEIEAIAETPSDILEPGENRNFYARIPFDASGYTDEQIRELRRNNDDITIYYQTESGTEMSESLLPPPS